MKSEYHGESNLTVGNGNKLPITYIGRTKIPSLSSHLYLRNILLVPQIKKSLLSVSRLTADNKVFVEFHSNVYLVKDKENHQVVLQGKLDPPINPEIRLNSVE